MVFCLLITAVFLGIYLAGQISRPVMVLAKAMGEVDKGKVNLLEQEKYGWQDEMGLLFKSYNEMGKRINDSIEKKKYAVALENRGIGAERIRKYGFAFEGKQVLIQSYN